MVRVTHREEVLPQGPNGEVHGPGFTVIEAGDLTIFSNGAGHQVIVTTDQGMVIQLDSGELVIDKEKQKY